MPLVLVHGLWDTPRLFRRLEEELRGRRQPLLVPHLPHGLGQRPLLELATQLGRLVNQRFGPDQPVDVLGFSMGGLVGRSWIQLAGGAGRVRRLISVGSPQRGSLVAARFDFKPASLLEIPEAESHKRNAPRVQF
jgi:triacylglycerol lipase